MKIPSILRKISLPLCVLVVFCTLGFLWKILDLPSEEVLIQWARNYFEQYGIITIFCAALLEGFLMFGWYLPGGLIIFLGVIVAVGDPYQAVASVCATIFGLYSAYIIDYLIGFHGWYRLFRRFGFSGALKKAQAKFEDYGYKSMYASYWQPNLAALVSLAAGISRASARRFFLHSFGATVLWCVFWGSVTYMLGSHVMSYLGIFFLGVMVLWIFYIVVKEIFLNKKSI